jgi:hypothetical protein
MILIRRASACPLLGTSANDIDVTLVRLFQSEAPAGGHAARLPAVPGPLTRRTAPAVPPATASCARPPTPRPPPHAASATASRARAAAR